MSDIDKTKDERDHLKILRQNGSNQRVEQYCVADVNDVGLIQSYMVTHDDKNILK